MNFVKQNKLWPLALIFCMILCFSGCIENFSLDPAGNDENQDYEQSDIGNIRILKVDPTVLQFIQSNYPDSLLTVEKIIEADSDGIIKAGNEYLGYCQLTFANGSLTEDVPITMQWSINKGRYEVDFYPDGLLFQQSVELEINYKLADLRDVDEEKIKLFYYNESEKIWELIGGEINVDEKSFKVKIPHFSRYALAHSQ